MGKKLRDRLMRPSAGQSSGAKDATSNRENPSKIP